MSKSKPPIETDENFDPSCFHIVALGASAGGLESLEQFFKEAPLDSGLAFVVLQHLSPDFRSLMDELLARQTDLRIIKAEDDMEVEPNCIYLNPPRKNMIVSGGRLYLSDLDPDESPSLPIDQFFRSLAQDYRRQAIAIVLSGTGSDGSRGVRDVYEAGGLVLAETEETAKFDGMPRAAQETGCVHLVLPPAAMPEALASYVNQALSPQDFAEKVFVPPRLSGMETVFKLLRAEYGIDFSFYKPNTVVRRVERRVSLMRSASIDEYVEQLTTDAEELNLLYRDLLIGVTRFFRDREAFDVLKTEVLPELMADKEPGDEFRVWVAGCATGEEAYSIAILIDEAIRKLAINLDVKIFATDVHPTSLEIASAGIYPEDALAHVGEQRLQQYFTATPEGYIVKNGLRQSVVFARHNVFRDAPFTKLDLISCRNLLIYLQPLAQKKALSLFHFGLRPRGILVLGPSESPGELKDEFDSCNNRWKIFRKRRDVRLPGELRLPLPRGAGSNLPRPEVPLARTLPSAPPRNLLMAYDALLKQFVATGFLVDDDRNLLHVFGDAKAYLEFKAGRISTDLLEVVIPEIRTTLASALQRARRQDENQVQTVARLEREDKNVVDLAVRVSKLDDPTTQHHWFLISLQERVHQPRPESKEEVSAAKVSQNRVDDLEVELRYAKENLQTTVEELETSNEELQATNEELVASNEELQSTNEELHSVNEELYTVNAEYQNKISELTELTADMDNLLESTEIGTVFLDDHLAIRKYTGKVAKWFDIVNRDLGRKISAFSNNLNHPDLLEDVHRVLQQGEPLEREIQDRNGKWLHLRLHPYRRDHEVSGVVMTLIDISSLKQTKAKLQRLSAIVESSDDAIIGKNFNGRIESWNPAAERLFGYTADEAIGQDVSLILPQDTADEALDYFAQIRRGESVDAIETQRLTKHGDLIDIAVRFSPIRDDAGQVVGLSAICRDISKHKQAEREVRKLALVARHTDNAVVLTDVNGLTEWVNEGFSRISGYTLDELKGRKPGHVLQGPDSDPEVIHLMRQRIAAKEEFNVEIINYTREGKPYWLSIEARPLFDVAHKLTGFMAVQRDVTELKRAQSRAREEVRRRDKFLAMLSHELRNPLSAIKNGMELLRRSPEMPLTEREEFEDMVGSQVTQISRLLDDLLDVSRITQDKILMRKDLVDLCQPAHQAIAVVSSLASQHNCVLEHHIPHSPVMVWGDAARLQQVQVNLLSNAIRHSAAGQVVSLQLEKVGSEAVITVIDQGEGIAPEFHEKIFDLFYQTKSAKDHHKPDGGLGLGLSLVRDFVARHQGHIQVRSDGLGHGAKFVVTLPLAGDVEVLPPQPQSHNGQGGPLRIVVVEDQAANRLILQRLLEAQGHTVWVAATGQDGIQFIRDNQPDLALIDIGLPDISGYDVVKRLTSENLAPHTLLAALTGYGRDGDIEKALTAGFAVHLVKPLDHRKLDSLMATITPR